MSKKLDIETKKFLRDLHKDNSLFLNKAMLAVPAVSAPILLGFLSQKSPSFTSIFIIIGAILFTASVLLLLHSCFLSEKAIDELTEGNVSASKKLNNKLKRHNKIAFWLIVTGFAFSFASIIIIFILNHSTEKTIMSHNNNSISNKDIFEMSVQAGASIPTTDGISIPKSVIATAETLQKGLVIPQDCLQSDVASTPVIQPVNDNNHSQNQAKINQDNKN